VLNQDFKEFLQLLNANEVKYVVIGGYALAAHGCPRYTKDIDVWIERNSSNALKLIEVLKQFGFASLGVTVDDLVTPEYIVQLGYPPSRIDLITDADGVNFSECYASKVQLDVEGVTVNFINKESLIRNKKATARTQDLADIEALEKLEHEH
jgi:predicted nucleotidyltransferase